VSNASDQALVSLFDTLSHSALTRVTNLHYTFCIDSQVSGHQDFLAAMRKFLTASKTHPEDMDGQKDGPALAMRGRKRQTNPRSMPSHDDGIESILSMRAHPLHQKCIASSQRREDYGKPIVGHALLKSVIAIMGRR